MAIGEAVRYLECSVHDAKLLTYTSAALDHPLEVTGHPVVTLFVSSTASDATPFVYLEDVDDRGHVAYVTEGLLRATNRRLSEAPAPYRQSVPYRTFKRSDARPLVAGQITELTFDLLPTCPVGLLAFLGGRGHDSVEHIQLRRGQCLEEEADDVVVDRVAADALTDRDLGLLP